MSRTLKIALLIFGLGGLGSLGGWWWWSQHGARRYVLPNPSQAQSIELFARPAEREGIYALELNFTGHLTGEVVLQIGFEDDPGYARKRIKAGAVQTRFESEWYNDHCRLRYQPLGKVQGNLEIQYQFIDL